MNDVIEKAKADIASLNKESGGQQEPISEKTQEQTQEKSGGDRVDDHADYWKQERAQREYEKAVRSGWRPKDQFEGDLDDFLSPRQWNINVALLKRAGRAEEEQRRMRGEIDSFGARIENVMKVAKANAIAELEAKKRDAVENADYDQVRQIDDKINQTNKDFEVEKPAPAEQSIRPEVEDWIEENSWFSKDQEMTDFALSFQEAQLKRLRDPANPTPEELREALRRTTSAVKLQFEDKFKARPRAVPHDLERGGNDGFRRKFSYNDLSPQEKFVCDEAVRSKSMTRDEYVQAIYDIKVQNGELK